MLARMNGMVIRKLLAGLVGLVCILPISAQGLNVTVPMHMKSAKTYYVTGRISDTEPEEFMVDTGSSYTTINEVTLAKLQVNGNSRYLRDLVAIMANGKEMVVPVHRITNLDIGGVCILADVEVAVFPATTRQILGLSALRKASPFQFSVDPPELRLSNCRTSDAEKSIKPTLK